jgi:hypothetical protein
MGKKKAAEMFRSRIVGEGELRPSELLDNPKNWRKHPKAQLDALQGLLSEVGWVQRVIVNRTTGHIVDGHARVELARQRKEPTVPVLYVALTEEEEALVLATIDPIGGMAETDQEALAKILEGLSPRDEGLAALIADLGKASDLDAVFSRMLAYFKSIPALSIAMAQTGDFPGGDMCTTRYKPSRKAMNSFICAVDRPFEFVGRINEDVNTYTSAASRGGLFLTIKDVCLQQKQTQSNAGGMTDLYLDSGTYIKSFYSVMYQPSSVKVAYVVANSRIHHKVTWRHTAPCILSDEFRKPRP